jgi:hypothetical protein
MVKDPIFKRRVSAKETADDYAFTVDVLIGRRLFDVIVSGVDPVLKRPDVADIPIPTGATPSGLKRPLC